MKNLTNSNLTQNEKNIINDLRDEDFDDSQIIDAMEDGEYLSQENISQEQSENIHSFLS